MKTNFEHFKDELLKSHLCGYSKCEFVLENILKHEGISCEEISCSACSSKVKEWFEKPYEEPKEPKIDWAKVPPDTRVIVSQTPINDISITNHNRYFAKYEPKSVHSFLCYSDGTTSWSKEDEEFGWKYCKLADPADVEKYKK
jgi:ferredoxin